MPTAMLFRRRNRELDEEISSHLAMAARDGAARREFGPEALIKEVTRDQWRWARWERIAQDGRYAARQLRANPGFTAAAVLTLALGIGANSAIFSVVNAVLLNPLPYPQPERPVVGTGRTPSGHTRAAVSPPDFRDFRDRNRTFEHFAATFVMGAVPRNWNANGEARQLKGAMVSAAFFEALGFTPVAGRSFTRDDEQAQTEQVVVLSHRIWQQLFGGDRSAVGRVVRLDGNPVTIVGVMPAGLDVPRAADFWYPTPMLHRGLQRRFTHFLLVYARLRPGVTQSEGQRDIETVAAQLAADFPSTNKGWSMHLRPLQETVVGNVRPVLWILLGAVGLVLLIACVNIANLLLARYGARQRELAIRAAIGASRGRILRQLLTENLLLATLAGGAAIAVAYGGIDLLRAFAPPTLPRVQEVRLDARVALFTAGVSLLTALCFGVVPAFLATTVRRFPKRHRLGGVLVVAETALSICLLIGAALLVQSVMRTLRASTGFHAESVFSTKIMLAKSGPELIERILPEIRAVPGVTAAGTISEMPMHQEFNDAPFDILEHPPKGPDQGYSADFRRVSDGYFEAMSIPVLRGRSFASRDRKNSLKVAIVDEPLARAVFKDDDPVGKHLRLGDHVAEIVGVVGGVRNHSFRAAPRATFYLPMSQESSDAVHVVIRASADPGSVAVAARDILRRSDPDVALGGLENFEHHLSTTVAADRFNSILLSLFAVLALALAVAGVYGVFSYVVTQQTREIGVRMALGARPGQMMRLILSRGAALAAAGAAIGLAGAWFLMTLLEQQLYGIQPRDPATFAVAAIALVAVALCACAIPARRAMRVDPLTALRSE
jgi:predicted permease